MQTLNPTLARWISSIFHAYLEIRSGLALEHGGDVEAHRLDLPEEPRGGAVLHHTLHLQGQLLAALHRDGLAWCPW